MRKKKIIIELISCLCVICVLGSFAAAVYLTPRSSAVSVISPKYSSDNGVSLMFNVYQGSKEVGEILSILDEYKVTATFFLGGCWVAKNRESVERLSQTQNEIGSHGYYHYDHSKLNYPQNMNEIKKSIEIIEEVTKRKIKLFAPPSGSLGKDCEKCVEELGLAMILWSKDTIDWRDRDSQLIASRALDNLKNGDFILMHPTEQTVKALPVIIMGITQKGLKITTVGENLGL